MAYGAGQPAGHCTGILAISCGLVVALQPRAQPRSLAALRVASPPCSLACSLAASRAALQPRSHTRDFAASHRPRTLAPSQLFGLVASLAYYGVAALRPRGLAASLVYCQPRSLPRVLPASQPPWLTGRLAASQPPSLATSQPCGLAAHRLATSQLRGLPASHPPRIRTAGGLAASFRQCRETLGG